MRDLEVVYGRVEQVSPLIRRVVAENPSRFTYLGTGTYIVGRGEVAVIDPGPALDAHVDAIVAALEPGERVTHMVVTHTHSDHSPATRALGERTDAPTWGFGPHGALPDDDPADRIVFGDEEADRADAPRDGDVLREAADTAFVSGLAHRARGRHRRQGVDARGDPHSRATRRTTCASRCARSTRSSRAIT